MIHITTGDIAADLLANAGLPGEIRVYSDILDRGPLPVANSHEFASVRAQYLATLNIAGAAQATRDFEQAIDFSAVKEEVILWIEADLFDQLILARIVALAAQRGLPTPFSQVSIDRHPAVEQFLGYGQLNETQLAALWPERTPIGKDAVDEATAAWVALTSQDPRALSFVAKRIKALPFLAGALERWIEEFPDTASGLTRTERQVLAALARGVTSVGEIMKHSHSIDPRYPLTDTVCQETIAELTRCELASPNSAGGHSATALGKQALAANHDRIAAHGIVGHHGGVAWTGTGATWRYEPSTRGLVWR